jgi:membrane-bound metal-dependent hydrolase YbcI (DUF457 family)
MVTALIGTFSHVILDSMMHADMNPIWPLTGPNPLLGFVSLANLHFGCLVTGIAGLVLCKRLSKSRIERANPHSTAQ